MDLSGAFLPAREAKATSILLPRRRAAGDRVGIPGQGRRQDTGAASGAGAAVGSSSQQEAERQAERHQQTRKGTETPERGEHVNPPATTTATPIPRLDFRALNQTNPPGDKGKRNRPRPASSGAGRGGGAGPSQIARSTSTSQSSERTRPPTRSNEVLPSGQHIICKPTCSSSRGRTSTSGRARGRQGGGGRVVDNTTAVHAQGQEKERRIQAAREHWHDCLDRFVKFSSATPSTNADMKRAQLELDDAEDRLDELELGSGIDLRWD